MIQNILKVLARNIFLSFILISILSHCTKIDNDKVEPIKTAIRFTDYLKSANIHDKNEFRINKNDNNIGYLNNYGFDTWSTVGKTGVNRLVAPSVIVSNDSVMFSLIVKFDDMGKQLDISTIALISNELNEMIKVPLNKADDNEYIGLVGYFQNKEVVDRFKTILNGEDVRVSFLDGNDHIFFGLSKDDKRMLNTTIELFYKIFELKKAYYNNINNPSSDDTKQITTDISKSKKSEAYNIYGDFEAYFPSDPQVNQSNYLKMKNIFHCYANANDKGLRCDGSRYALDKGTIINDFDAFMESFIETERSSISGELFHKRKTNHNGNTAYYYVLIYNSEDYQIAKHSLLILTNKYLYKWTVQGIVGLSDDDAAILFNEKKNLFRII